MPEGLEVEIYRRAAVPTIGRRIESVAVDDRCAGPGCGDLSGCRVEEVERVGKLLLVHTSGPTLGIHFGMTGRLVVDGVAPIERLEYGSGRDEPQWDRFVITFEGGGLVRVNDPRRWSSMVLEPDTTALGPDVLSLQLRQLRHALDGRIRALKAVLLDQRLVAGLGNLCVDEVLWHARISPHRPAATLTGDEVRFLHRVIRRELPRMLVRGGSHRGTVSPALRAGLPPCPLDGAPLRKQQVAGRTTVWCPRHQG